DGLKKLHSKSERHANSGKPTKRTSSFIRGSGTRGDSSLQFGTATQPRSPGVGHSPENSPANRTGATCVATSNTVSIWALSALWRNGDFALPPVPRPGGSLSPNGRVKFSFLPQLVKGILHLIKSADRLNFAPMKCRLKFSTIPGPFL